MDQSFDTTAPTSSHVQVGVVLGVHGHEGFLRVRSDSDNPKRFTVGATIYIEGQSHTIQQLRETRQGILLKLEGVDSDDRTRPLINAILEVRREDVPTLPEDSYYHFQLIGLQVFDALGVRLGKLTEVLTTGANDVYVVVNELVELLIPALAAVIIEVDLGNRTMTVDLPEGLGFRSLASGSRNHSGGRSRSGSRDKKAQELQVSVSPPLPKRHGSKPD